VIRPIARPTQAPQSGTDEEVEVQRGADRRPAEDRVAEKWPM
jgi:hypothetical protein